jgi:group I intron endonuclease
MYICNALFKHGYSNFSLTILEYCESEKCLEREGYYQKKINPEYNICKEPGAPMSGREHSDETKKIMSEAKKGENHPMFGQTLSEETRKKISDIKKGQQKPSGSGSPSQAIEVFDLQEKTKTSYNSIHEAARALNLPSHKSISMYFKQNQQKPYKGRYTFSKCQK